jgi:hypothetical protein
MTSLLHCSGECNRVTPVQKRARRQAFQEPRERHENVRLLSDVIAMMCRLRLTDRLSGSGLAGLPSLPVPPAASDATCRRAIGATTWAVKSRRVAGKVR